MVAMEIAIAIALGLAMLAFVARTLVDGVFDGERPGDPPRWVDDPGAPL